MPLRGRQDASGSRRKHRPGHSVLPACVPVATEQLLRGARGRRWPVGTDPCCTSKRLQGIGRKVRPSLLEGGAVGDRSRRPRRLGLTLRRETAQARRVHGARELAIGRVEASPADQESSHEELLDLGRQPVFHHRKGVPCSTWFLSLSQQSSPPPSSSSAAAAAPSHSRETLAPTGLNAGSAAACQSPA